MQRADVVIFKNKLAPSRQKALEIIKNGNAFLLGEKITKPSQMIDENAKIEIRGDNLKYVSRGGFKLESAIENFGLDFNQKTILDMGSSTGGFTDCALQHGAKKVFAVELGSNQLVEILKNDKRVESRENTDVRDLSKEIFDECDIIVADLSFVSEVEILSVIMDKISHQELIILIKPQFEATKSYIKKCKGVIRDYNESKKIALDTISKIEKLGFVCKGLIDSPIKGGDGNSEFVAWLKKC